MTDKEPTYHFVKGQGWVAGKSVPAATVERVVNGKTFRITVENRCPNRGERGWWVSSGGGSVMGIEALIAYIPYIGAYYNEAEDDYSTLGWLCDYDNQYTESEQRECLTITQQERVY